MQYGTMWSCGAAGRCNEWAAALAILAGPQAVADGAKRNPGQPVIVECWSRIRRPKRSVHPGYGLGAALRQHCRPATSASIKLDREPAMTQQSIFGPFFATMFLTLVVWVYMYVRRIHFINSNKVRPQDLAVPGALARISPAAVSNPSDNLRNLFEMPVLFYALALYLFVTSQVDAAHVYAGWVFAGFRVLHSAVHCTFNRVLVRFYLYLISTVALWFIALRAGLRYFGVL
jgi:hypothetical protein